MPHGWTPTQNGLANKPEEVAQGVDRGYHRTRRRSDAYDISTHRRRVGWGQSGRAAPTPGLPGRDHPGLRRSRAPVRPSTLVQRASARGMASGARLLPDRELLPRAGNNPSYWYASPASGLVEEEGHAGRRRQSGVRQTPAGHRSASPEAPGPGGRVAWGA